MPAARVRFDRNEFAGSVGDVGTDLPLILAMIPAAGLDTASVFIVFGAMQVMTGFVYGLPMPVQPLKAMAALVIANKTSAGVLHGGGIAVGAVMLILSITGILTFLARSVPRSVVRGIQAGLGITLAHLATTRYIPAIGIPGWVVAGFCFLIAMALWDNRKFPAALLIVGIGVVFAAFSELNIAHWIQGIGFRLPEFSLPAASDIYTGFFVLALPQIPLSLSNSVIATHRTIEDLFPGRNISEKKIGLTYSLMNLVAPLFHGVPVCHGCGGLAGHYAFGGRTGGSVVLYGSFYLIIGLFLSGIADELLKAFPLPVLGVILVVEAVALIRFLSDVAGSRTDLTIAIIVAIASFTLPSGFLTGMMIGIVLHMGSRKLGWLSDGAPSK